MDHRSGFTLVEVVVAFAILLILMVGLLQFYARTLVASRNIYITETAEALAEIQAEDLRSMSVAALGALVRNTSSPSPDVNYRVNQVGSATGIRYLSTPDAGQVDGYFASDFVLSHVESITLSNPSLTVWSSSSAVPTSRLLLPASVEIVRGGISPDQKYVVTVMKSSFPNMYKRVELALVSDGTFTSGAETLIAEPYIWSNPVSGNCVFKYTVSVKWTLGGRDHVFKVSGFLGRSITG
jgi:prepilin-type N-terminal cleavage/methylation domain-containing protein